MTHENITAKTDSSGGIFRIPMVEIECEYLNYSNTGTGYHGLQVSPRLLEKEEEIKSLCSEISDKLLELHKLVNE